MAIDQDKIDILLGLLKMKFPDWGGFSDQEFMKEEIIYKRKTSENAARLLGKDLLKNFLENENYNEFIENIEKIGKDTNLLWRQVPRSGDLRILYTENLDKGKFCKSFYDLLHGDGTTIDRMASYFEYIMNENLTNQWTFPTYFLFFLDPEKEYFVKPSAAKWFLDFFGSDDKWESKPNVETYAFLKKEIGDLMNQLNEYNPQDFIDIQSFIYVCHQEAIKEENRKRSGSEVKQDPFINLLGNKKQIILYGPPGTGKTYYTKKLCIRLLTND